MRNRSRRPGKRERYITHIYSKEEERRRRKSQPDHSKEMNQWMNKESQTNLCVWGAGMSVNGEGAEKLNLSMYGRTPKVLLLIKCILKRGREGGRAGWATKGEGRGDDPLGG